MTADVGSVATSSALLPKIHVSHFGQDISFTSRDMFQAWANDYILFLRNSGSSVAYINIGDYSQDTKNYYSYLEPALGTNNVPWIVTDFLDKLPAGVEAGVIAYLDVANPWKVYDANNSPTNVSTTDGKSTSPAKNNVYQAFQMVNAINAAQLQSNGTKFFTHFQADGEGAGAFESDSYYGFGPTPAKGAVYNAANNLPAAPTSWTATDFPVAGYGYTKWLWNSFMPGVTADQVALGGTPLPASATVPDVVFTHTEAIDPTTWSGGTQELYQFGIIKYAQTSWLNYSPGPMLAYTENYWFGENHYMPGPGSAIAADGSATINYVATPILNPPATANTFASKPTVTFNQPRNATGIAVGTAAQGYAVMGTGSIDTAIFSGNFHAFFGGSGVGQGYSPGAWVTSGGSGYTVADQGSPTNPNVTFTAQGGDTPTRVARGYVDTVATGEIKSITILDPGEGYTQAPLISMSSATGSGAQAVALILESDGYPTISFPNTGTIQATGYLQVSPQGYRPGAITNVMLLNPGLGYPLSPINTQAPNPLATTTGLKGTLSQTFAPAPYLSQILAAAGATAPQAAPPIYAPVTSSASQVDSIVVTVLGDHYDAGPNKPFYTLSGDPAHTQHYLTGGAAKNGVSVDYNSAYASPLNLAGSFVVDDAGVSGVTVITSGMGYSAGAVVTSSGGGYDKSTTYPVIFPAPAAPTGTAAKGFLNINADGKVIGITVTDPGTGYVATDDGGLISLPAPAPGGSAGTAHAYLSNYPKATISEPGFGANGGTAARAFVITGPTDPKNPQLSNPSHGYIVTGIGFTYPGVGYMAVPSLTIAAPPSAPGNVQAVVQALPALASKYTAAQLPTIKTVLGTPQTVIKGGANAYNWQVSNGYGPGQVTGVTITGGSGYTTAPTVTFSAPPTGGRLAQGTAVVASGVVTMVTITQPGYGYDPEHPPTVTIAAPGGPGTQATGTVQLGDLMVISPAAVNTVYDFYKDSPELLAAMFNETRYQDVALPKLREEFYWPLQWTDFNTPYFTDGTKTPQQAIATFSIESLNRSNTFDSNGNYVPGQTTRTSLDSKYQPADALTVPNTLGGTFAGLSSLSYENFVTFLNTAATIIASNAPKNLDGTPSMRPQDVTFQVYDAAFLPIEWLTAQNANRWAEENMSPILVSGATGSVPENAPTSRVIYLAEATDIGATAADRTLRFSLKPGLGDDASLLTIDPRYGEVRLRNPANYEAKATYSFTVMVSDGGSPALSAERAVAVHVLDLLEAPAPPQAYCPTSISVVEDTPTKIVFHGTPFTDADSPAARPMTVTLRVPDGGIAARTALGVRVGGTATARTFTGTIGALNAYFTDPRGHITYRPAANVATDRPLTVVIREGAAGLASRAVTTLRMVAVNDAPQLRQTAGPLVVRQGRPTSLNWAAATRAVTDVDSPHVTVTMAVGAGILQAVPAAGVTVANSPSARLAFSGSSRALSAYFASQGRVRYTSAAGDTSPQTLSIVAADGIDETPVARRIRIVAVPQAPQIGPVAAFAAIRGVATPLAFAGTPFSDPDAARAPGRQFTATLTVADGAITARLGGGVVVGGTPRERTFTGTLVDLNRFFTNSGSGVAYTAMADGSGSRPLGIMLSKRVADAAGLERTLSAMAWSSINVA